MFTRIPVNSIVSTRLERPYEMNGSVRPVVGSRPITTPMCRNAVSTVVNVSPTATSWRNGVRAWRAMRNPSSAYSAKAIVMRRRVPTKPHSSPTLLADEVAVGKRDEVRLLHSLPEAAAEPAAGAHGDERLRELEAHRLGRASRMEERR